MRYDKQLKAAGIPYQTVPDVIRHAVTKRNTDKILAAPTETFEERTNREQMTSWLYGSQTEPEVWREGRRIK